ncbi:MAG: helical backbone metal receptor [Bryobacteraceae bacterium]
MTRRLLILLLAATALWGQKDVISLSAPLTETMYLLGQQGRLAAMSDTSLFPEQAKLDQQSGKIRKLGFSNPDMAVIDAIRPKLILTSTAFQRDLVAKLRAKGYKVLHFEPDTIEDIFMQTEQVGEALGKGREAGKWTRAWRSELAEIGKKSAGLPRVRVYIEINHNGPWTSGGKTTETEMIRLAGGENVFADRNEGVFVTSNAEVVKRNPDIILSPIWLDAKVGGMDGITPLREITSRTGYDETTAVKNSRVLYYDSALFKQQGPREVLAVRKLAYLLHPEEFPNPAGTIPWELGRIRQ